MRPVVVLTANEYLEFETIIQGQQSSPEHLHGRVLAAAESLKQLSRWGHADYVFLKPRDLGPELNQQIDELCDTILPEDLSHVLASASSVLHELGGGNLWKNAAVGEPSAKVVSAQVHGLGLPRHYVDQHANLAPPVRKEDFLVAPSEVSSAVLQAHWDEINRLSGGRSMVRPRINVIPFGTSVVDVSSGSTELSRRNLGWTADSIHVLTFGRLSPYDKCDLVPFLQQLAVRYRHDSTLANLSLHFCIAGAAVAGSSYVDHLQQLVETMGLASYVTVMANPSATKKDLLFRGSDVFLGCTDAVAESFGLVVLEASSYALPIVAPDWSGYREIVDDGVTGFLVPTRAVFDPHLDASSSVVDDQTSGLRRSSGISADWDMAFGHLTKLARSPSLRQSLGRAGQRRIAEKYSWRDYVQRLEQAWSESVLSPSLSKYPGRLRPREVSSYERFATKSLTSDELVTLTMVGKCVLNGEAPLDTYAELSPYLDNGVVESILRSVYEENRPVAISALLACNPNSRLWVVGWMLKVGLMRVNP